MFRLPHPIVLAREVDGQLIRYNAGPEAPKDCPNDWADVDAAHQRCRPIVRWCTQYWACSAVQYVVPAQIDAVDESSPSDVRELDDDEKRAIAHCEDLLD